MKRTLGILGLVLSLNSLSAATIKVQVKDMDHALKEHKHTLIFLSNGTVAKVDKTDKSLIEDLSEAKKNNDWLEVTLNKKRIIEAVASIPEPEKSMGPVVISNTHRAKAYAPNVVSTPEKALAIYKSLNRRYKQESQCYNRAHVWSWEMLTKHQVNAMKVFMFFHKRYIRRFNFEWWFHVAPYIHVKEDGKVVERVMDFRYTRKPIGMKEWTDIFMGNNAECGDIKKYTEYEYTREDPSKPWCYLLRSSPYYYQPVDLEGHEKRGLEKDYWVEWELNNAYHEAFGV